MKSIFKISLLLVAILLCSSMVVSGQEAMQNVLGRNRQSLNGRWSILTDVMDQGLNRRWGNPVETTDPLQLNELHYEGGHTLYVPGDWNSQSLEFQYYEAPMWYHRTFYHTPAQGNREFLHFAAVASHATVFLNGEKLGEHTGGFTPFQFEVTENLKSGKNVVVVRVDNRRSKSMIPAIQFDWWSYGGITRDVDLISTPQTYIKDYWVRLKKGSMKRVIVDVQLDGVAKAGADIEISIAGTSIVKRFKSDGDGSASIEFDADLDLWSPSSPRLYSVNIKSGDDSIEDRIGFRSIEVEGSQILLNGEPIFLRGVNIHEEISKETRRSIDLNDAHYLTQEALDLGCNFVRLSHYPHNEYMVRLCEERGIILWEEIPMWQDIEYSNPKVCELATGMMREMISRDKNRCAIAIWSVANETFPWAENRTEFLKELVEQSREWDDTRAITSALNSVSYDKNDPAKLVLNDPLAEYLDIIGVNMYMGWYMKMQFDPAETELVTIADKPIILSEYGAGAVYANYGDGGNINSFSEDYMAKVYRDNLVLFEKTPNLCGTAPWILFDFRSPVRAHSMYQQGWNRKGLISPEGNRKSAWYIMRDYYNSKK